MITAVCATAMSWVGLALLYAAWSRRIGIATLAGWGTLLSSIPLWIHTGGADRGVAIGVLVAMLGAFLLVAAVMDRRERRTPKRAESADKPARPPERPSLSDTALFTLCAGPLALAAAVALSLAAVRWLPIAENGRLITVGLLTPVLWGAVAVAALYCDRPWRPAAVLGVVGAVGMLHY